MRWLRVMLTVMLTLTLAACGQATVLQTPTLAPTRPPLPGTSATADPYARSRKEMVMTQIEARDVSDRDVLEAMNAVPRHEFVPQEYLAQAYEDHPLPIGYGQTISQPYIVALMTQLARPTPQSRALEVGVGSGLRSRTPHAPSALLLPQSQ